MHCADLEIPLAAPSVGEAKVDENNERTHVSDLASKVRELNKKLEDIRKEQQFQREREHDFRTLSDRVNWRTTWWSVLQILVLVGTCAWQLRTLRVGHSGAMTPSAISPTIERSLLSSDTAEHIPLHALTPDLVPQAEAHLATQLVRLPARRTATQFSTPLCPHPACNITAVYPRQHATPSRRLPCNLTDDTGCVKVLRRQK